ncbi:unnamed protein product [Mytilus coruscus]|uniref:Uncharacterized protein n=1 Tax=Mytilus coruscus TaxID=42192 RepID=A0A6J8ARV9_MYTCO|nr:unnamed protein product [Mytilus coruscus]
MGFDKDIVKQDCGCYTKYWSHDSFNYSGSDHFTVCLKHKMHNSAKQMNFTEWQSSLKQCADDLRGKMKSEKIIPLLRQKYLLTTNDEERLVKISDEREKTTELLLTLYKLDFNPLPQLKLALIKTAQSELIQYIIEDKSETKDEDLLKAYYGSCFIHAPTRRHVCCC